MRNVSPRLITSLAWTLGSGLFAWVVLQTAFALDLWRLGGDASFYDPTIVHAIPLMAMFAVASLGLGALIGERIALGLLHDEPKHARMAKAAIDFSRTIAVVSVIVAFFATSVLFLSAFGDSPSMAGDITIIRRLLETYIPIIGYTAFAVWVLLSMFVFHRTKATEPAAARAKKVTTVKLTDEQTEARRKNLALAFTLPIVALALGLIIGLIVYDLTNRGPEASIWLLIASIVGSGVVAGTVFAARAGETDPVTQNLGRGPTYGARMLSFVLSVLFGSVVSIMSFVYGQVAIDRLQVMPYLSTYIGIEGSKSVLYVNGSDLKPFAEVEVGGDDVFGEYDPFEADSAGYLYEPVVINPELEPGKYVITATAVGATSEELATETQFEVTSDGEVVPEDDTESYAQGDPGLLTPDMSWWFTKMLPALGLFLVAEFVLGYTLIARNRRRE